MREENFKARTDRKQNKKWDTPWLKFLFSVYF